MVCSSVASSCWGLADPQLFYSAFLVSLFFRRDYDACFSWGVLRWGNVGKVRIAESITRATVGRSAISKKEKSPDERHKEEDYEKPKK
jgi:hypothetical protein